MSLNSLTMSFAVSGSGISIDPEHQRIMRALKAYGIQPSGIKSVDRAKLYKIQEMKKEENIQMSNPKQQNENLNKTKNDVLVDEGKGTEQIAMLKKYELGLM